MRNIMTEESILEILSKFEDDLKYSKFVDLYNYMEIEVPKLNTEVHPGEVTRFLLDLGINPLKLDKSFTKIPRYYLEDDQWVFNFGKLPDNIKEVGRRAFSNSNLTYIDLNQVEVIKGKAFASCKDLKKIFIPKTVKELKGFVFIDSGIEEVEFEKGGDCWLMHATFNEMPNLKKIIAPQDVLDLMTDNQKKDKEIVVI